jgi:hypothetical protein
VACSLGPQVLASLGLLLFSHKGHGSNAGMDQGLVMLLAICIGIAGGVLVLLGSLARAKGTRAAFAGGAALGLGLALLLAFPLCLGTIGGVRL